MTPLAEAQILLKEFRKRQRDLHMIRFFSAFVFISGGKVIHVTEPGMRFCPLVNILYGDFRRSKESSKEGLKHLIKGAIEKKISEYGHFTGKRCISSERIEVPYGASEIIMYGLREAIFDCAVMACDGAGTVVTERPEIAQGIGARMNGLFFTSPVKDTIANLEEEGCVLLGRKGEINQVKGVRGAIAKGYRRIAVTVGGLYCESLKTLRELERRNGVSIAVFAVCTTGVNRKDVSKIKKYADLAWSCGSSEIREVLGKDAIIQLSEKIPVYIMTQKGVMAVSAYAGGTALKRIVGTGGQYLVDSRREGRKIKVGDFKAYIKRAELPVRSDREPVLFR